MDMFWKTAAGVLIAAVLVLAVGKQEKDLALLLTMAVCTMTAIAAFYFLEPVISFLYRLEELGDLQTGILSTLLKIAGIGLVCEIAGTICQDSGNASLAKGIGFLGTAVILSLSVPVLQTLLDLIQDILGEL